ncbi:hypothetical protein ACIBPB_27395 [Micromonospora sp. NPDC049836]|uniref:hypothetical protein n=1 Tax=Micromonospora sp. NPDC049836 TaxID=3364274 RepID=UPI00378F4C0F
MNPMELNVTDERGRRVLSWADTVTINRLNAITEALQEAMRQPVRRPTEEEDRALLAHNRRVREHNARVLAERERVERERQARENARETAAVRKRLCDSCFCELPASGVCGMC